jgi:hypothetical protein
LTNPAVQKVKHYFASSLHVVCLISFEPCVMTS